MADEVAEKFRGVNHRPFAPNRSTSPPLGFENGRAAYTKEQLDTLTGGSAQYFGLDATSDGKKLLLGGLGGKVFEFEGRPSLTISQSGTNVLFSWPASVSTMVVQSSPDLSTSFVDLDPQPAVVENGDLKTVTIAVLPDATRSFFRLRK